MEPGYRSPLIDLFRRGEIARDMRLLAAEGALAGTAHEQIALLMLLSDDPDSVIAAAARTTISKLPVEPLQAFLARNDAAAEMKSFFAAAGIAPGAEAAPDASSPLLAVLPEADEEGNKEQSAGGPAASAAQTDPQILSGLPVKKKVQLAFKGSREQRAQLIRDPNKLVAAAVLSSPKLTEAEIEAFTKMGNVGEDVLRVIGTNRSWLKNYGVVLGLVKHPKTPLAISMQLLQRINERDMKLLTVDRNVPEALRLAARKFILKGLR